MPFSSSLAGLPGFRKKGISRRLNGHHVTVDRIVAEHSLAGSAGSGSCSAHCCSSSSRSAGSSTGGAAESLRSRTPLGRADAYAYGGTCPDSVSPRSAFRKASNAMSRIARMRVATSSSRSSRSSVASASPMIEASGEPRWYS